MSWCHRVVVVTVLTDGFADLYRKQERSGGGTVGITVEGMEEEVQVQEGDMPRGDSNEPEEVGDDAHSATTGEHNQGL